MHTLDIPRPAVAALAPMRTISSGGVDIPVLGLGTYQLGGEVGSDLVATAIGAGYRHIDTATMYGNEAEVGAGIRMSGVPRDELFVTTKIWFDRLEPDDFVRATEASLARLGLDRLDLLLVHWPNRAVPLARTMPALAGLKRRGLTRAIGVANFPSALLREAMAACDEPIATDQVEFHPYLDQTRLLTAARDLGVALTAYRPLGHGNLISEPVVTEIARAHGATPAQIALAWSLNHPGVVVIPKTAHAERLQENLGALALTLTADEMARIAALAHPDGRQVNPAFAPVWD